jgi:hypothetical protein
VSLEALGCVIQQFLGKIAALFCSTPHHSYAIFYCIGNCAGCARSLVNCFRDVFGRSFRYGL